MLFNRFDQSDIDLDELEIKPSVLVFFCSPEQSAGVALISDLDWHSTQPCPRESGRGHRRLYSRRCDQTADGGRRCDHALLRITPPWHRPSAPRRSLRWFMEDREYESVQPMQGSMSQLRCQILNVRTRSVHESRKTDAARAGQRLSTCRG